MLRWILLIVASVALGFAAHAGAQSSDQVRRQYLDAYHALEVKDDAAVLAILNAGYPVNYKDDDGYTLLHVATRNNRVDIVQELLKRGADPAAKSNMGFTPLDSTTPKIIDMLIAAGAPRPVGYTSAAAAKPSPSAAAGQTADQLRRQYLDAYHALEVKDDEAVLAILNKDFPVNYQDDDGYTLLHIAASNNRVDMVKELLKRGANPAAKSRMGFTPVDSGITVPKIVDLLVEAGGPRPAGYKSSTTKPATPAPAKTSASAPSAAQAKKPAAATSSAKPASKYEKQCQEKWYADQALCSDSTCKMRAYRKWDTCLKTGSYY